MKSANFSRLFLHAARQPSLIAGLLLFVRCALGQDALEDRQVSSNSVASDLNVEISDDLVTLKAHDVGVRNVLDEIARQTNLIIVWHDQWDDRLILDLERLPLHETLRRILPSRSYVLYQARPESSLRNVHRDRPSILWVFSDGSADYSVDAGDSPANTASAIMALQSELTSADIKVRRRAIQSLRRLKLDDAVALLSFALGDQNKKLRVMAVYALADIGGHDAVAALATASVDEDAWVRAEAAYALGMIGGDSAILTLRHALYDGDRDVRESAIEALTEIGGARSAQMLATALQDPDAALRMEAVEALSDIGGETAVRVLDLASKDADSAVQKAADQALAELLTQDE